MGQVRHFSLKKCLLETLAKIINISIFFNFLVFIWKFFVFGSVGNNDITFPTLFYSMKTYLGDAR